MQARSIGNYGWDEQWAARPEASAADFAVCRHGKLRKDRRWRGFPPYDVEKCASVAISEAGKAPAHPLLPNDSGYVNRAKPERN